MKAKLVHHDGYLKIEYQHCGTRTRKSTGITILNKTYLKSETQLKSTVKDYQKKQVIIDKFITKAENIISDYMHEMKTYPSGEQFKRLWEDYDKRVKDSKNLMEYYEKFIESKVKEFSRIGYNGDSIKDYRNIKFYLEDFITDTRKPIYVDDIDRDWLNSFVKFLESERVGFDKSRKYGGKYWSKGGLVGSTIKKRVGLFIGFLNWCVSERHFPLPKGISKFSRTIEDSDAVKSVLNKEEVNRLYKHDFNDDKLNYIKDVFVFSCFTGMRWLDIQSFNKRDIHQQKGLGLLIEKKAQKTKDEFRVPLNSVTNEIILKYAYEFNRYKNANFNKYLKLLLKQTGWFDEETKFQDENGCFLKRWECISIHRGRDSFCTMLVNDRVPLNEIMKYTGHKHLSSLNKYIDLKSEISNFTNELVIL